MSIILNESHDFRTAVGSSSRRIAPDEKHRPTCGLEAQGGAVPTPGLMPRGLAKSLRCNGDCIVDRAEGAADGWHRHAGAPPDAAASVLINDYGHSSVSRGILVAPVFAALTSLSTGAVDAA
jgi:hypothetical protein